MRYLILTLLLAASLPAADHDDKGAQERLERVGAEVAQRKVIRDARELIRAHEAGKNKATEEQLAAARAVIRESEAQGSKQAKGFVVSLSDADVQSVAKTWLSLFGEQVVIAERVKMHTVTISISDPSREELKKQFEAALRANGLAIVKEQSAVVLDVAADAKKSK